MLVLIVKDTQSIRTVDFRFFITQSDILHGAMFDFAEVTGNSVLEH